MDDRLVNYSLEQLRQRMLDALLLAELWLRSTDERTRMLGADLKQLLTDD